MVLLLLTGMPDSAGPSGSFLHKPVRGWLHPDQQIIKKGISYAVRVSCLEIENNYYATRFEFRIF